MLTSAAPEGERARARYVTPAAGRLDWQRLQAHSNLPTVQDAIRRLITRGIIRVAPWPGDDSRVRIIPPAP